MSLLAKVVNRHEFLFQRGLIKISTLAEGMILLPLVVEPLCMGLWKGSWNVYRASRDFVPSLRHAGLTGDCINLYLADGGLFDSLGRKFRGQAFAVLQMWARFGARCVCEGAF